MSEVPFDWKKSFKTRQNLINKLKMKLARLVSRLKQRQQKSRKTKKIAKK